MKIEINNKEIIPFENFTLAWRWYENHNANIPKEDIAQIAALSEIESKRIYKIIEYFERETNLSKNFDATEWIMANSETIDSVGRFSNIFSKCVKNNNENIYISWDRTMCVYTTKDIFIKYWDDFCYPCSDDITIISELTDWVYFYNHGEIGRFWKRRIKYNTHITPK